MASLAASRVSHHHGPSRRHCCLVAAGQDVYQTPNELFFTPRSVVIQVFDMQQFLQDPPAGMKDMRKWLDNVSLHSPSSPIVLVGTRGGARAAAAAAGAPTPVL